MRRGLLLCALLLSRCSARGGSGADAGRPLEPGDALLCIDGPFGADLYLYETETPEKLWAKSLLGCPMNAAEPIPRESTVARRDLRAGCPPAGTLALVRVTEGLWDVSLSIGSDGTECFVMAEDGTKHWATDRVFALPARHAARQDATRRVLQLAMDVRAWIPARPAGWRPEADGNVLTRLGGGRARSARVGTVGAATVYVTPEGGRSETVTWAMVGPRSPERAEAGDVVEPIEESLPVRVLGVDDAGIEVERIVRGPTRIPHGRYQVLRPRHEVELPVGSFPDLDLEARSLLVRDLVVELGGMHTRNPPQRADVLEIIRPDGTVVADAESDEAIEPETDESPQSQLARAKASAEARGALLLYRTHRTIHVVRRFRIRVTAPAQLSAQARATLASIGAGG